MFRVVSFDTALDVATFSKELCCGATFRLTHDIRYFRDGHHVDLELQARVVLQWCADLPCDKLQVRGTLNIDACTCRAQQSDPPATATKECAQYILVFGTTCELASGAPWTPGAVQCAIKRPRSSAKAFRHHPEVRQAAPHPSRTVRATCRWVPARGACARECGLRRPSA